MNNRPKTKFEFDEIVRVVNPTYADDGVLNLTGYVGGKGLNADGMTGYSVFLFTLQEEWDFNEEDLETTGEFVPEGFNQTGVTIRVRVNEKGEGEIVDP